MGRGLGGRVEPDRAVALAALDHLGARLQALGHGLDGVIIHHDRDSVYTSYAWVERVLLQERARLSYAENGARDCGCSIRTPWIESFWGRFKTENLDLFLDAETLPFRGREGAEVTQITDAQLAYYNGVRRHSALDYRCPKAVLDASINPERNHAQR